MVVLEVVMCVIDVAVVVVVVLLASLGSRIQTPKTILAHREVSSFRKLTFG